MTLYAFESIDDALEATRAFLWPPDLRQWAKLALVVFFLGGAGGFNPVQFPFGGTGGGSDAPSPGGPGGPVTPDAMPAAPSLGTPEVAIVAAIVGVVALVALGFALVGAVMEFVFVESLRREAVQVRRYWGERWRQGLRLFGFRIGLGLLTLFVVGALVAVAVAPFLLGSGGLSVALLVVVIPLALLLVLVSGLVGGFTTMFVVPIMLAEDRRVLDAWRRFRPTLTDQWKQYAAYAVMAFVLQLAAGILASLLALLGAVVVGIPLGLVGLLGVALLGVVEPLGLAVIAVAALLFGLALVAISLAVSVPVQTFLRYYALLVLGETNAEFDVIPDRRRALGE